MDADSNSYDSYGCFTQHFRNEQLGDQPPHTPNSAEMELAIAMAADEQVPPSGPHMMDESSGSQVASLNGIIDVPAEFNASLPDASQVNVDGMDLDRRFNVSMSVEDLRFFQEAKAAVQRLASLLPRC